MFGRKKLKVREGHQPDFVGSWSLDGNDIGEGMFYVYFDKYFPITILNTPRMRIKGTIDDRFGEATFEGEMDGGQIEFVKGYTSKAIKKGAHPKEIKYKAEKINGIYIGEFHIEDPTPLILGVNNSAALQGDVKFIMYDPISKEIGRTSFYKIPK